MKRTIIALAVPAAALTLASPAIATQAYMDGMWNVGPGWSTITMPDGSTCAAGCKEVIYNHFDFSGSSAARGAGAWMDANNNPDAVLYAYSLGSVGVVKALETRPDWQGKVILLGSPVRDSATPDWPENGNVTVVSVDGDSVTQKGGSFLTHMYGYKNRNFATETPIAVTNPTGAVEDRVYSTKPPKPTVTPRPRFNLFDIRTWFPQPAPKTPLTEVVPAAARVVADEAPVSGKPAAEESAEPTRAERRAERKAEREAAAAERKAERAEAREARRVARAEAAAEREEQGSAETEANDSEADSSEGGDTDE